LYSQFNADFRAKHNGRLPLWYKVMTPVGVGGAFVAPSVTYALTAIPTWVILDLIGVSKGTFNRTPWFVAGAVLLTIALILFMRLRAFCLAHRMMSIEQIAFLAGCIFWGCVFLWFGVTGVGADGKLTP
jgi:hypothetical protein